LDTASLMACAQFDAELRDPEWARRAAGLILKRADASVADQAAAHILLAGDAGLAEALWRQHPESTPAATATAHLKAACECEPDPAERLRDIARLIRHVGVAELDGEQAVQWFEGAKTFARKHGVDGAVKRALRETAMALGDVHLFGLRGAEAAEAYLLTEALADTVLPMPVRAGKTGAYPERIGQHLEPGRFVEARAELDAWRNELPSDQVGGVPIYLRGKMACEQKRHADAVRLLTLAIPLAEGAEYEAEARWLLAEAHGAAGNPDARRATLRALIDTGLAGPWLTLAREALEPPMQREE